MSTESESITSPIKVLLADDHDILRQGLKLLLEAQPDIQVVGEARTGTETIIQAEQHSPQVVVMDITMPEMDGLKACQVIRQQQPDIQVLILTMHESEEYFLQALRMGASGYLVKKAAPAELCAAVRTTARGGVFLYPGLAKALVRAYLTTQSTYTAQTPPPSQTQNVPQSLGLLTPRELEVLTLVAEGYTSQEIADQLVLSIKTVQAHRANIMEKLDLRDLAHLIRFAIHHRLISTEP
ncbi:MAG TPA: response regulator transcription factor [Ktedonobacteraceae bacterium]|jgi:DNA-binding NarL/FixJ family response regulator|nr:response regulator transcription factor [Ktedonobacteraceae bacterium]